ncbi:MAG: amidase [Dehalococcoidia bacterium]|nr:amidase [Dehalococcoidia bacterium]
MAEELFYLSIAEAAERIQSGVLSPVELTEAYLEQIEQLDSHLNAYITVTAPEARAQAEQAHQEIREGRYLGPLHGIPIALKDLVATRGGRTTAGSKVMAQWTPAEDAAVVTRLREAGAVILGKTGMHEFAYGPTGINPHYGTPLNPWDDKRMPGGSSSGSGVAAAAGLCAGAIGSDTGGSIRIPASLCGIVGLKPTYGRVSRRGAIPLSWSLDHVGPMVRRVEDAALMLNAIAGYDPTDPGSANITVPDFRAGIRDSVRGLRIGIPRNDFFQRLDHEVADIMEEAIRVMSRLGAVVREIDLPLVRDAAFISAVVQSCEAATYHLPLLREHWDEYSESIRNRLLPGLAVTGVMYLNGQRARALLTARVGRAMEDVDILLIPTVPVAAPTLDEETITIAGHSETVVAALTRLNRPFNVTGLPSISLPCGSTKSGLPVGMQLAGRSWEEATVLRAAYAYEVATEWYTARPPVL